jgi:hypothetical protein
MALKDHRTRDDPRADFNLSFELLLQIEIVEAVVEIVYSKSTPNLLLQIEIVEAEVEMVVCDIQSLIERAADNMLTILRQIGVYLIPAQRMIMVSFLCLLIINYKFICKRAFQKIYPYKLPKIWDDFFQIMGHNFSIKLIKKLIL